MSALIGGFNLFISNSIFLLYKPKVLDLIETAPVTIKMLPASSITLTAFEKDENFFCGSQARAPYLIETAQVTKEMLDDSSKNLAVIEKKREFLAVFNVRMRIIVLKLMFLMGKKECF